MEVSKLNRFIALLIDGCVFSIPAVILGSLGLEMVDTIVMIAGLLYILLRDALFGGQSIGKKIMKYKAVTENGVTLSGNYGASFIRNISMLIPLVDFILVLINKPRLGDGWAKTRVVNV